MIFLIINLISIEWSFVYLYDAHTKPFDSQGMLLTLNVTGQRLFPFPDWKWKVENKNFFWINFLIYGLWMWSRFLVQKYVNSIEQKWCPKALLNEPVLTHLKSMNSSVEQYKDWMATEREAMKFQIYQTEVSF